MVGQAVTINYSVAVVAPGTGTPSGNVTVSDGTQSCTGTVAAGTCSITFTTAGAKSLTATYAGNTSFNGSVSSPATAHTVNKANTTTTITSDSPDPSVVGQAVTINYSVAAVAPGTGTRTGNVTVSDGTQSCTGTVAAGTCSITFTTAGAKSLTATYAGDANFNGSASTPPTAHTVNPAAPANTTTTITSDSPDPSVVGQPVPVNYSVAVVAPGTGTPTGNVTVSDGTQSCTGTVAAGTCSITFTTPGAKSLTATYAGNTNFNGSTSSPAAHTVNKANTTATISSDLPDPSVVGQAVTINYSVAVVAPGTGTPSGNVTVSDGTQSCTGTVAAGTCSITFTTPGAKSLTATYAGDANFNSSASTPPTSHTVNPAGPADTTTSITSDSPNPSVVGQMVTFNYSVAVVAPGTGTPSGNVTVSDGTQSCTGTVAAGTCSIAFTTSGNKKLTATYAGDANFNGSTSSPATTHNVQRADTTTTISSDLPDPSAVGESVTINYSVAAVAPGAGTASGNVTVSDGTDSCTGTAAAGTCSITFTTPGVKSLTASYVGDGNFNSSVSTPPTAHTVNPAVPASTTTSITSDLPDPSLVGEAVTINYSVAVVAPGTGTPTGNVTVSDGADSCSGTVAAGTCSITFTTPGLKSLTATYAGDANFNGSVSTPPTDHTVNPAGPASTTTSITSDLPDPSAVGEAVTIIYSVAVVAPGSGTPTGNVTVSDGAQSCTATVAAGTCSITFTTPGVKSLVATYTGDANFLTSTSAAESHTVSAASTTTSISSDLPDPSVVGEAVTINYSVAAVAPGTGTPSGNVTVSDGTDSCTGTVAAGTCSLTFTTPGVKSLTATYAGDANFNGSVSTPPTDHTVNPAGPASTTTSITSDLPDPSAVGEAVTIIYSVAVVAPGSGTPTGNVTVSDGADSCSGTVAAGTCSITFTTSGVKSLAATYAGDANFLTSTSAAESHTVSVVSTTTSITSDLPDPSVVGEAVTINYSVAAVAPGSGTPTGNVTVSDGTDSCTGTVAAGTCSITFTTAGAKSLTATYAGDGNFTSSASAPETHAVNKADTTTTIAITSDLTNHSVVGQPITISYSVAVIAPGSGIPTGDVTVLNGSESCLGTVAGGSCSITFTSPGAKTLVATYTGDANFNSSVSTPVTAHMVDPADTTTTVSSDLPDPSAVGEAVTINYSVAAVAPGAGTPTGNVTVSDGADSCTGTVAAGTCSITFTTSGVKSLTATYAGDVNFNGSVSTPPTDHTVNPAGPASTTTSITSDLPDPSAVGEAVTINYSVAVIAPGSGTPTGNVTVSDGADSCSGTVAAGTCSITFTTPGVKSLVATYAGDVNFLTSTSAAESHTVSAASTTTSISSDLPDPSVVGEAVTINYSVAVVAPGSGTPSGNVTVSDGADSCTGTVAAGTCSITFTTPGVKSLAATYAGDANFLTSTSAAESHTVSAASTTTSITSDLPDPSVVGEAVTINYSVAAVAPGTGTPSGNVTVSDGADSCTGTVAAGTCSITFTTPGVKSLTATYAGDGNFNSSVSTPPTDHTVNTTIPADTTTSITSDLPNPSVVGESVTFNYSVAVVASGTGTLRTGIPTGNVTVSDGTDSCTATVAAGTCSIAFTTSGNKKVTATYAGDANFNSSTSSPAVAHNVQRADTTTVISSDLPDPSAVGEAVTINYGVAAVVPGAGTPTGNVTVSDGTDSCTGTAAAGTCSITFTTPGVKSLTATYAGDGNYNASASTPPTDHTVNPAGLADTSTSITSDLPDPSVVGQPVPINYSVAVVAPGIGTPTGNVTVSDGAQSCTGTVATGTCSITFTTPGTKSLTATYAGDANFNGSTSTPATPHTVNKADTTTTISSDLPDPSAVGEAVTINYSAAAVAPGAGTPTGNVTVSDGADSCTGTVAAGTCSITFTTPGVKSLAASYAGDVNFNGSVSTPPTDHTVNPAGPASTITTITSHLPEPSVVDQTVAVSVSVTGAGGTPTGTVAISGASSNCTITLSSGSGSCNVVFNTVGTMTLTATYSGDSNYAGSSDTKSHTVAPIPTRSSTTVITGDVPDPSTPGQQVVVSVSVSGTGPIPTGTVEITGADSNCTITLANGTGSCNVVFNTAGPKTSQSHLQWRCKLFGKFNDCKPYREQDCINYDHYRGRPRSICALSIGFGLRYGDRGRRLTIRDGRCQY